MLTWWISSTPFFHSLHKATSGGSSVFILKMWDVTTLCCNLFSFINTLVISSRKHKRVYLTLCNAYVVFRCVAMPHWFTHCPKMDLEIIFCVPCALQQVILQPMSQYTELNSWANIRVPADIPTKHILSSCPKNWKGQKSETEDENCDPAQRQTPAVLQAPDLWPGKLHRRQVPSSS